MVETIVFVNAFRSFSLAAGCSFESLMGGFAVTFQEGTAVWLRRRPIHPVKPAFVLGPACQVQQVPSSPALRARSVLRANWLPTCLTPERLRFAADIEPRFLLRDYSRCFIEVDNSVVRDLLLLEPRVLAFSYFFWKEECLWLHSFSRPRQLFTVDFPYASSDMKHFERFYELGLVRASQTEDRKSGWGV